MAWSGASNIESAARILGGSGNKVTSIIDGGKIVALRLEHVWVESYCSVAEYRGAGQNIGEYQWIPFDPSYKEYKRIEGINLEEITGISEEDIEYSYIYSKKTNDGFGIKDIDISEVDEILDEAKDNINEKSKEFDFEGKRGIDILGGLDIIEEKLSNLPYSIPNKIIKINKKSFQVEDSKRDYINFSLNDYTGLFGELSYRKAAVELYGKKITLSWVPASNEDKKVIDSYGGDIFDVPAYLIEVKPVIKVNGEIVATGSKIEFGEDEFLNVTINEIGFNSNKFSNVLVAGGYYGLGLDYGVISPVELEEISARTAEGKNKIKEVGYYSDEVLGEVVNGTIKSYFSQVDGFNSILAERYNISDTRAISFGISGISPKVETIINKPIDVKLSSLYVDIDNDAHIIKSYDSNNEYEKEFTLLSGMNASAIEHSVVEQVAEVEGVSTIKVLQEAIIKGIPIYKIDGDNINEILPMLEVNDTIKTDIKNAVNSNMTVTIPKEEISIYDWNGTGYIILDEDTGSAGYMISGGLAGGNSTVDFSKIDWEEVGLYFLIGLGAGAVMSVLFGTLAIGLITIAPVLIPAILEVLVPVLAVALVASVAKLSMSFEDGGLTLQQYLDSIAFLLGNIVGGLAGGKFFEKHLAITIKTKCFSKLMEKYGYSDEVTDLLWRSYGQKKYEVGCKIAKDFHDAGIGDDALKNILIRVPEESIPRVSEILKAFKAEKPDSEIDEWMVNRTISGVKNGESNEEILGIIREGDNSFIRNLENVDELNPNLFKKLKNNGIIKVNKSGSDRPVISAPNSYYTTNNGEHVFVYDENGKLIYDLSIKRVKAFKINVNPAGEEFFQDYKLNGSVPDFIKNIFGW